MKKPLVGTLMVLAVALGFSCSRRVQIPGPLVIAIEGELTKIDGKTLTIKNEAGGVTKDYVLTCTDATSIVRANLKERAKDEAAKFEVLKVGQRVDASTIDSQKALGVVILKDSIP